MDGFSQLARCVFLCSSLVTVTDIVEAYKTCEDQGSNCTANSDHNILSLVRDHNVTGLGIVRRQGIGVVGIAASGWGLRTRSHKKNDLAFV